MHKLLRGITSCRSASRRPAPLPVWGLGVLVLSTACVRSLEGQTPQQVENAIERGVDYLKSMQRVDGSWDDFPNYDGGITALATLALLSCDEPPDSPEIQRALQVLRRLPPTQTYVVALQTMAFAEASPKEDFALIKRNAEWLMRTRLPGGLWYYGDRNGPGDNSNTQYALLGLHAASSAGVEIPDRFWAECREYWLRTQTGVGSWGYSGRAGASGSMTAAGISSLVISGRQFLSVQPGRLDGRPIRCAGSAQDRNLAKAIEWMGRNFAVSRNPLGHDRWLYYYLYGLERAGRLTGRRFFEDHDWYRRGAAFLIVKQSQAGYWAAGNSQIERLTDTSFSLLFLSKGRIPILIDKLRYGRDDDWNNAPNDVNNLTEFMARLWNKKLNWQVVDVGVASVEDLLQAPVLQFSGHQVPTFTDREKRLLREYAEQGGLIFVDANCSADRFDEGFRALCKELFPEPGQELVRLDRSHGVWNSLFELSPDWPLFGVDVGCRTVLFYSPEDLSCRWEHKDDPTSLPAFRIGANVIAYAVGPEDLADKLEERKVIAEAPDDEIRRNFLQVAKIRHNGDWNPAPRAIPVLMSSLRELLKVDVIRQQRSIDLVDPNLVNYPLAYMHGRTRFQMTQQERDRLEQYLRQGGVLFADACCGSERFDRAFRELVEQIFPESPLRPIPVDHELLTREIGYDLGTVEFGKALGNRQGPPLLEGIEVDGRYAVIYSKYDLGCALERQQSSACPGYSHESAVRICTNIVLYALNQ